MEQNVNKGNALALLPIGVFLVVFLGSGIITGDFYAMPQLFPWKSPWIQK